MVTGACLKKHRKITIIILQNEYKKKGNMNNLYKGNYLVLQASLC